MELMTTRDILFVIAGLIMVIGFKHQGRALMEERKKMNRAIKMQFQYNERDVKVAQFLTFLSGIVLLILGLASLIGIFHIS